VKPRWRIGDRVCRHEDVFNRSSTLMVGTVIERYSDTVSKFGPYPELYEVEWDGGIRQRGFLPHGLDAVVPKKRSELQPATPEEPNS